MVNISDVAREAGVSVATVSRVLNDHPQVDPALAARVRSASEKLRYRPNTIARSLRTRSTAVIALIISDVANPFFTSITRGVEDVARSAGYSILLCNADEDASKESTYLSVAEQAQVAGVILSPHMASSDISALRRADIPIVLIDRPLNEKVDSVMVNSVEGARVATDHLIDARWTRPALITGPKGAQTAMERLKGYRNAIRAHGGLDEVFVHASYREQGGADAAATLLDSDNPPDALFVANAQMALGVLAEVNQRNLRIGVDLGLITFDDAPWAPFVSPPMSVVAQPAYDVGAQATQLLVDQIRNGTPKEARQIKLSTTLIVRESSRRQGGNRGNRKRT